MLRYFAMLLLLSLFLLFFISNQPYHATVADAEPELGLLPSKYTNEISATIARLSHLDEILPKPKDLPSRINEYAHATEYSHTAVHSYAAAHSHAAAPNHVPGFVAKTVIPHSKTSSPIHLVTKKSFFKFLKQPVHYGSGATRSSSASNLDGYISLNEAKAYVAPLCGTCAFVSSSGQMLHSGAGNEIDAHDCVIRMNVAPVKEYESDVGRRTTIRMISHTSIPELLKAPRTFLTDQPDLKSVVEWGPNDANRRNSVLSHIKKVVDKKEFSHATFYTLTQAELEKEDDLFEKETGKNRHNSGSFLSTGWFTLSFARKICDKITIFGMVTDDHCKSEATKNSKVPYHYYEADGIAECAMYRGSEYAKANVHRFITEKGVFKRWASLPQPPITFRFPDWN